MRVLLCLAGDEVERGVDALARLVPLAGAEVGLLHVVDSGAAVDAGLWRGRYIGRADLGRGWRARVEGGDRVAGEAIARRAAARLEEQMSATGVRQSGVSQPDGDAADGDAPEVGQPGRVEILLAAGRPEREIERVAGEWRADLVVVCARQGSGPLPPPGPRSVGHVARFVLDHAPCAVLLIRP